MDELSTGCDYAGRTFTSGAYVPRFVDRVVAAVGDPPTSILDLGCGTGSVLIALAKLFPSALCRGVDISPLNVAAAQASAVGAAVADRTSFLVADYLRQPLQAFDLVVCYSTFHLIDAAGDDLIAKLASDVRPDGIVVLTIPADDGYNRWLFRVRRMFRALRSRFTDWLILRTALVLVRGQYSRQDIADRVSYMYVLPKLLWGEELSARLRRHRLATVSCEAEPHASFAQPKHVLVVLRRMG